MLNEISQLLGPLSFLFILGAFIISPLGFIGLIVYLLDKYSKINLGTKKDLILKVAFACIILSIILIISAVGLFVLTAFLTILSRLI